tara:strand:+ start:15341 stop:16453 length:1113 start_codon:yes stop_codon:yes gene_type:complete
MNPDVDSVAIQVIQIVLFVLISLFLVLIVIVLIRRVLLKKWAVKMKQAEEKILPILYEYLDSDITQEQFSKHLRNRFEVISAFKNTNILIDNFDGEQKAKLKNLLNLSQFNNYFKKGLRSASTIKIAQACMYYEKKDQTEDSVIHRLKTLQFHSYPVIKYGATLALINTDDQEIRDEALRVFVYSGDIASMAVNDVIYKYCNLHKKSNQAANTLFRYISDVATPVSNAEYIVRIIPELGYYQLSDDLVTFFKYPYQNDIKGQLTSALIDTLSEISNVNILDLVDETKTWKSEHTPVRLSTAKWIQKFYSTNLDPILINLANDHDLDVRINAQMALLNSHDKGILHKNIDAKYQQEWIEIKDTGGSYVDTD